MTLQPSKQAAAISALVGAFEGRQQSELLYRVFDKEGIARLRTVVHVLARCASVRFNILRQGCIMFVFFSIFRAIHLMGDYACIYMFRKKILLGNTISLEICGKVVWTYKRRNIRVSEKQSGRS